MKSVWRALGLILALLALAVVAVNLYFAAMITWWRDHAPRETSFMAERMRELDRKSPGAQLRYQFVPYERIAGSLKRAMVAAEDSKFVEHEGFDWDGIELAMEKNQKRGRIVAGGSTITQQLAKNLFLSGSRSWLRKGEEAIITLMLEAILDKRRIFELYLNVIEWGNGVFGAEAAAVGGAGGAAGGHGAQSALLRAQRRRPGAQPKDPHHSRANAGGRVAV